MKILVSACLLGRNCKYSGGNNRNPGVLAFVEGHTVIPVCPEELAGLGTPRVPMEIVNGRITNREGVDHDDALRLTCRTLASLYRELGVDCAVLQSRSPTCGVKQVYDGSFSKTLVDGMGAFAEELTNLGIRCIDGEDLL